MIYVGFDAQPKDNLAKAKELGANAMHRYDSGPQKNVPAKDWMEACKALGLSYIVQGTFLESQKFAIGDIRDDANLISISQNDEPDLNRWNPTAPDSLLYSPSEAPHVSVVGWTKPSVLATRYANWIKTGKPISVNFNGTTLTNAYYADGKFHKPYIAASDYQGLDLHVVNNRADEWRLYQLMLAVWKVNSFGGKCLSAYFEMSDQVLDSDALGGPGRGPTAAEVGTQIWGLLAQGVKQIWGFPQQIGRDKNTGQGFSYWNVKPEIEQCVKKHFNTILKYAEVFDKGTRTLVETPALKVDSAKGVITWPLSAVCTWELDGQKITVNIDYTGKIEPTFSGLSSTPVPEEPIPVDTVPKTVYDALMVEKDSFRQLAVQRKAQINTLVSQVDKAQEDLANERKKREKLIADLNVLLKNV